jgi:hypothetical protein
LAAFASRNLRLDHLDVVAGLCSNERDTSAHRSATYN